MIKEFTLWDTSYPAGKCNVFSQIQSTGHYGDPPICQSSNFSLRPDSESKNSCTLCYIQSRIWSGAAS